MILLSEARNVLSFALLDNSDAWQVFHLYSYQLSCTQLSVLASDLGSLHLVNDIQCHSRIIKPALTTVRFDLYEVFSATR